MPHGPNSYSREVTDTYPINQTGAANAKTKYKVQVTVNWDFHRRKASGVKFASGMWLLAGKGPLDVFKTTVNGQKKKVGTIAWAVVTGHEHRVETNAAQKKFRNIYVPWVRLTRTFTPANGTPPSTEELPQQASGIATDKGSWQPIPE
jgi:hypothetical protein